MGDYYDDDDDDDEDDMYLWCTYTSEWGVVQGEHLTLQLLPQPALVATPSTSISVAPSQLLLASSSPPVSAAPVPVSALRFPVALFLTCDVDMCERRRERGGPELLTFYEPQQLSLFLWDRPDGMTEGLGSCEHHPLFVKHEPLPPPDDDPLPSLLRAMQTERWRGSRSVVIHDARRVDCTVEDERKNRQGQKEHYQRESQRGARAEQRRM